MDLDCTSRLIKEARSFVGSSNLSSIAILSFIPRGGGGALKEEHRRFAL